MENSDHPVEARVGGREVSVASDLQVATDKIVETRRRVHADRAALIAVSGIDASGTSTKSCILSSEIPPIVTILSACVRHAAL